MLMLLTDIWQWWCDTADEWIASANNDTKQAVRLIITIAVFILAVGGIVFGLCYGIIFGVPLLMSTLAGKVVVATLAAVLLISLIIWVIRD